MISPWKRHAVRRWLVLAADHRGEGHAHPAQCRRYEANGGRVVGAIRHPLGTTDYSGFLQQASRSRAQVIGLANASPDTGNAIRHAAEFRVTRNQRLVAFLMFVNDVHAVGLDAAQGLLLMEAFYWDIDDRTRAFSRRFQAGRR
ncbi:ABC transporter substrate-binding protein [Falsiroseomonas sp. HW251]|uniref:ABC transporter substrate-binding protein n=1 Tax=Falsiroseomonas sp. HW251 TaxID=3390998 RepID=UPI003D322FC8